MHIHRSNRVEELLAGLSRVVARPQADPLTPECIVVQGRGMERWLSLELADRLGVFAHPEFPFPRAFLQRTLDRVLGDEAGAPGGAAVDAAFEPAALMWSIAELLPGFAGDRRFAPVIHYLDGDAQGEKALQLARRIAETLDHYVVYRPDWVLAWEEGRSAADSGLAGRDEAWQSELWRALVARHGSCHLAARITRFIQVLEAGTPAGVEWPARVSVFGLSTLPPLFLAALAALGRVTDLHLFVLSPSQEYWAEIRSARELIRRRLASPGAEDADPDALHFEEGHPLLASLGRVGRDFQSLLEASVDYQEGDEDLYRDPLDEGAESASLLRVLQSDILHLVDRGPGQGGPPRLGVASGDDSIQLHACHGPMREAEVLRDQLLELFERDPTLEPRDVIVMTPKVEIYAPFIEAAFGAVGEDRAGGIGAIPCKLADRGARSVCEVVEAFFRLLDVLSGRLGASAVLDLVGLACIRNRFGIDEADEARLRDWVFEAGVRWGIDAQHRAQEGQPPAEDNTWRFGLDRLLLGYAMADRDDRLFGGVRPLEGAVGAEAALLGKLADFTEALFDFHARAQQALDLPGWRALLAEILDRMIETDSETVHQRQMIRDALRALAEAGEGADFSGRLTLSALSDHLDAWLARTPPVGGFLSGGVTFCELVPMRTVPFRVVCLMGLSDHDFPRVRRRLAFDLMGQRSRPGDRTSREDDRYLFLEALLSARDHFLVTYRGQSQRDNEPLPPSVVVGELLDHLDRGFFLEEAGEDGEEQVRDRVQRVHPLQPFSQRYFAEPPADDRLFSYSATAYAGAQALWTPPEQPERFFPSPLSASGEEIASIEIDVLTDFFRNPARALLRGRLGLFLPGDDEAPSDREPMEFVGLDRWRVGDELVGRLGAGVAADWARERVRGLGLLPLGELGEATYEAVEFDANRLVERAQALSQGTPHPAIDLDLQIGPVRLVGQLAGIWEGGRVQARFSKLEGPWELEEWIRHLAFCAQLPPGCEASSHLVGQPGKGDVIQASFGAVKDAHAQLEALVATFLRGQRTALPFFPKTSRKYAQTLMGGGKGDPEEQAILDAYRFWRPELESSGSPGTRLTGECEDVYFARAFGGQDPLAANWRPVPGEDGDGFRGLARQVFGPLLEHREGST